jgi:hypothetical protein
MAITYGGSKRNYQELAEVVSELYSNSGTFRDGFIDIQESFKSGADVYESKVSAAMTALNTSGVTATGNIGLAFQKTPVSLFTYNYEDTIDDNVLKGTMFEKSMKTGAFNLVSDEFDKKVLIYTSPAISEDLESKIWNGATTATKAAIAGLTPGAGQGSVSAGAQALVAAMPTTLFDSITAKVIYNDSQSKAVPGAGLGDYIKVGGGGVVTPITSSTIATEYAKIYAGAPEKVVNNSNPMEVPYILAPRGDRQLIKIANNAVGASQQINFLIEGTGVNEKIYYNGIEIKFVPLVGFRVLTAGVYLKLLMDLTSDVAMLEVDKMANGALQRYIKNVGSIATWVTNQRYITLYNG